jgi:hypothetical protein
MPTWLLIVLTLLCGVAAYMYLNKKKSGPVKQGDKPTQEPSDLPRANPVDKQSDTEFLTSNLPDPKLIGSGPSTDVSKTAADRSQIEYVKDSCKVSDKLITFDLCNLDPTSEGFETAEPLMLSPNQDVTITNNSTQMGVFKVRTNRRHRYIVQPSIAYLKPGESKQVKIQLRRTEVASIQKDKSKAGDAPAKKKTDTFLVQFMNLKTVFYYNQTFFDSIKIDTWLDKAGKLIKQVEKDNPVSTDRRKFFHYEKIYVDFPGDFASGP